MLKAGSVPKEADVVVVGGGTTGIVVATRLAKADPRLSIVILEQGVNVRNDPQIINPALYLTNIRPDSKTATFHKSEPSKDIAGREIIVPSGRCLGGGSAINFMVYSRPQSIDFDDWKTDGWRSSDMIPFLRKYENFQDTDPGINEQLHGYQGELSVSPGTNAQPAFQDDFFKACKDVGIEKTADVQDLKTSNAVGKWNMWIDRNTGLRQDVAHRYLFPTIDQANTSLQVATDIKVARILFDNNKVASGVEYLTSGDVKGQPQVIRATKLVVLASGALGSPPILERSGIGGKGTLDKLNIPLVSNLPGVGSCYQDHNVIFYPYKSTAGKDETLDGVLSGRLRFEEAFQAKLSNPKRYILGWNGLDCVGKLRPSKSDVASFSPALQQAWEKDFEPRPERPLMLISTLAAYPGDHSGIEDGQYFCCGPYTPYPYSRGSVHIKSKSAFEEPEFHCGFLSDPLDLEKSVWGYKLQRDIVRRMSHYRGPLQAGHPTFPSGSKADYDSVDKASTAQGYPVPIKYSKEDDEVIATFIRERIQTTWHSMGTCAMKPRESNGVVDENLNVYGVANLKVVDLSICPSNVSANTYATALAIGEKAASLIAKGLGIPYSIQPTAN
ncbi:putative choline dehydrogenase [Talaromyces proteolyticus]|uniref:Choline dehydrogenase n=1 Tax=Talaromyces proteolyticus TaxID=1131652 RepID=A0AAD4PY00_9EURO|nr:putative choline dehydrogenase [Talaromyces proteolyticus]KAH8697199.1 putative choline dehydrogenase [Talaromyces proteolyticus]